MRTAQLLALFCTLGATTLRAQDFLDQVGDALSFQAFDNSLRARLSGTLDLEYYRYDAEPRPGLIDAEVNSLFNPRLSVFLDAQAGPHVSFFSQVRLDRGFDPTDEGVAIRADEYALRVTPWEDGRLSIQVGKFAAVTGNWNPRHLSWDNPFITAPLLYEDVTVLHDEDALPSGSIRDGRLVVEKWEYLPLIWGPTYATGASVTGRLGKFDYAAEIKNAALSSRPESWDLTQIGFDHPTVNARVGVQPNEMWNFGFSASRGSFFRPEAEPGLPAGRDRGDYDQIVLGQDVSFAWRHLQVWAELYEVRFELPVGGNADAFAYYIEAKYKFTPQLFGALRWNQQFFDEIQSADGGEFPWWHDTSRLDTALIYRLTAHTQLKVQYNLELGDDRGGSGHTFAAQLTVRF